MNKFTLRSVITRAVRTAAQTAIAAIGTTAMIEAVDWAVVGSTSGLAALLSVLTSIVTGLPEDDTNPAATRAVIEHP